MLFANQQKKCRDIRFNDMGEVQALQGHSMPLMATGALFLWAGFFCFNSASVISSVITRDPADLRALNDLLGRYVICEGGCLLYEVSWACQAHASHPRTCWRRGRFNHMALRYSSGAVSTCLFRPLLRSSPHTGWPIFRGN